MANRNNSSNHREKKDYGKKVGLLHDRTGKSDPFVCISFRLFATNQGQSFADWQSEDLLALAIEKLRHVCSLTVNEATAQQIVKQYSKIDFPPNSKFSHPKHVPADVTWCSMHIQGKECVIGYFEENIFYVVFLDKNHEFWPSSKKGT